MSENSKKIFITTKTSEIFIIRRKKSRGISVFCPGCGEEVEMLSLDEAVQDSGRNTRELIRCADSGEIHSLETGSGHLLVCQNSLKKFLKGEKK